MLSPEFSFFLELLGATLLVVMIVYAFRLNRRLSTLQEDKAEFERLLVSFTESTNHAETSVARLKVSATDTAQSLQESVTRANALRDDLGFLVERADELASRLETGIREARPEHGQRASLRDSRVSDEMVTDDSNQSKEANEEDATQRKTKSDLLRALEGMR
ncbi:MAG: hypothetical protein CMP14_08030 [Rickettsiales bacterium]|nr:hypothetical protein [Rickettsiales bacterium]